jgi:hypothetical protein
LRRRRKGDKGYILTTADYQSAQKLSEEAYRIFKSKLLTLMSSSNNTFAPVVTRLEKNMADLNYLVDDKAPAQELMMVVHGEVHPNLQLVSNLKLKQ